MKKSLLVLIIDDEKNLVRSLAFGLKAAGIEARGAHDGASGLKLAAEILPDVVLLDLRLPDASGLDLLARLKAAQPNCPVIMISAHGDTRVAVQAVKAGATDYLTKPFDLEEVTHLIRTTTERTQLAAEVAYLRSRSTTQGAMVGDSPIMHELRQSIERIARSGARTILLSGPSGTGKAVVAHALHSASERSGGPFVQLNCASLPEQLLEAELFGAEKGAYTGAHERRVGLVGLANGGTLFLDEIGELAIALQAKLLTFLEDRTYRPIGAGREMIADVRVIAATNRRLADDVKAGRFREDLFYRLNVVPIAIPPLASRGNDMLLLAEHFARQFAAEESCAPVDFADEVQRLFRAYPWPGNVRELKNLIERLTILHPGQTIESAHLPSEFGAVTKGETGQSTIADRLAVAEEEIVREAIVQAQGRKGEAAERLGISRHALKRRIKRLKL